MGMDSFYVLLFSWGKCEPLARLLKVRMVFNYRKGLHPATKPSGKKKS
jgi:hypothetical protein